MNMAVRSWLTVLDLIGDETVINLQRTKVYVFSGSVLCLGKVHQHPESNEAWKKRIGWIMTEKSYRDYDGINGEPTEFEWNIFPGFTTLQLCGKVTDLLSRLGEEPETFTGRILFMSMFNDISCDGKDNEEEQWQIPKSSPYLQRSSVLDSCRFLVQIPKRSGILQKIVHKDFGIISRTRCCWNSQKADVLFSVQRLHCPETISKAKDTENCPYILLQIIQQLKPFFRMIVSANQLSLYGAVANMCEEFETHQDRSGEPDVLMGQSTVLSEIKAEVPLQNENPSCHYVLWQQYEERIESLSPESKESKFCMDAGFVHFVEVGQYFMTKDTGDFRQFRAVACRDWMDSRKHENWTCIKSR